MPHLARLYELHAEDCVRTAAKIDNPRHREVMIKLAEEWRQAAQERRQSMQHSDEECPSQKLQPQHPTSHTKRSGQGRSGGRPNL
jgi:hypothetical protein